MVAAPPHHPSAPTHASTAHHDGLAYPCLHLPEEVQWQPILAFCVRETEVGHLVARRTAVVLADQRRHQLHHGLLFVRSSAARYWPPAGPGGWCIVEYTYYNVFEPSLSYERHRFHEKREAICDAFVRSRAAFCDDCHRQGLSLLTDVLKISPA